MRRTITVDKRGQAHTVEAILSLLLILGTVLFVAPSLATPGYTSEVDQISTTSAVEEATHQVLAMSLADGSLKAALLEYDTSIDQWTDDEAVAYPGGGYFLELPGNRFGKGLQTIENQYDIVIGVVLIPESTASGGTTPDEQFYVKRDEAARGDVLTTVSTTVTLFDDDRLKSPPEAHAHNATTRNRSAGTGAKLSATSDYPIEEASNRAPGDRVYNVVTVRVVIYNLPSDS